jgi:hypothetical protein
MTIEKELISVYQLSKSSAPCNIPLDVLGTLVESYAEILLKFEIDSYCFNFTSQLRGEMFYSTSLR